MRVLEFLKNIVVFVVVDIWFITLITILGVVAVYFLLPQPRRRPLLYGVGATVLALVLTGWFVVPPGKLTSETVLPSLLFYVFAAIAIGAGGLLVTQRNPARAALSFAIVVLATCGLFLLQAAPFLMAATIIVYAGAIIVTFLFVLMLAQQQGLSDADARSREPFFATITGFLLLATLLYVLRITYKPELDQWVRQSEPYLERVQEMRERQDELNRKVREAQDVQDRKQREEEVKRLEREQKRLDDEKKQFAADLNRFLDKYDRWWHNGAGNHPSSGHRLHAAIRDAQFSAFKREVPDQDVGIDLADKLQVVESLLEDLHEAGVETRNSPLLGNARPTSGAAQAGLSEFSGPAASRRVVAEEKLGPAEVRRDDLGRPKMPAHNTAYLGRSLFSDYLLSVELAGLLLLVATIGAIAIAQRRSPPPTPGTPGPLGTLGTSSSQERTT